MECLLFTSDCCLSTIDFPVPAIPALIELESDPIDCEGSLLYTRVQHFYLVPPLSGDNPFPIYEEL